MGGVFQDLRYARRMLATSPGCREQRYGCAAVRGVFARPEHIFRRDRASRNGVRGGVLGAGVASDEG